LLSAAFALALAVLCLLVVFNRNRDNGENPYEYDLTPFKKVDPALVRYRETETLPVPLRELTAVAVDPEGRILVAGKNDKGVLLAIDAKGNTAWKKTFENTPRCLAPGPKGRIYVGMADHVVLLEPSSDATQAWPPLGEKALLMSIASGPNDVYAADGGQRRIWRFDTRGTLKGVFGEKNPAKGDPGFLIPGPCLDVALSPDGRLWTVDPGRHAVQTRTPEGKILSAWGRYGLEIHRFCGC
jgi:hypothetical protein